MAEETEKERVKEKKTRKSVSSHCYSIEGKKIERLLPFCERCGPGYFMANHGDRYTCGRCGFTRYKRGKTSQ